MRAYIQQIRQETGVRVVEKVFDPVTDKPTKVMWISKWNPEIHYLFNLWFIDQKTFKQWYAQIIYEIILQSELANQVDI